MRDKLADLAVRTSLIYALLASLWILFSDKLVFSLISDPGIAGEISIVKGWAFVAITAWWLYLNLRRQAKLQEREIAERKRAAESLRKTNRALGLISRGNQIVIRATDEIELLKNICRLVVEEGGYATAWVGYAREDGAKSVRPMAQAGLEDGFLDALQLTWADEPRGRGPVGTAIRTGRTSILHDLDQELEFVPWREEAQRRAYASVISLPLIDGDKTFGVLSIYSTHRDAFDKTEADLLSELIGDLAFGITSLRAQADRRRTGQALLRSEERLRLAQMAARIGIFDVDLARNHVTWTEEEEAIFGFAPGTYDHDPATWWQLIHPEDCGRIRRMMDDAIAGQSEFTSEYRFYRRGDQALRWASVRGKAICDEQGQPTRMLGVNMDITEHKDAEMTLRMSEALYHSLVEQSQAGIFCKDAEGRYTFANSHFFRITNKRPEQLLGKLPQEVWQTGDLPLADGINHHALILQTGRSIEVDEVHRGTDGETRNIRAVKSPIFDAQGKITGSQGILFDVTRLKQAEEAHLRLATAVEQTGEDILITDAGGKILYVNPAFEAVTGYTRQEVIGQNPRFLKSGKHDAAFYKKMWELLNRGEVWSGRVVNKKKNGALFEQETTISPIRDSAGKITNYVGVRRDVTREVALEAQLRQSQKMEAIGQLASGVAHDFNNLLTAIHVNASLLLEGQLEPGELSEYSQQILEATERAATLTRQLLMFSRKQIMQPVNLDLNEVVTQTTKMLRRILGEDILLSSNFAPDLPAIQADAGMIEQVLLNLAVNSRDAMPAGGKLVIATGAETWDEKAAARNPGAVPGQYACLTITDSGCGIPAEHLSRIFEPFFTTKEIGKGTGLGLATVYGIVQQHRGWINVTSDVNQGTTFRIYFPGIPGGHVKKTAAPSVSKLPRGTETILVVEDEVMVCRLVSNMLQRFGYVVWQAESGMAALKVWQEHKDRIQLLLTDVVMPDGLTGYELGRRLQAEKPELKVIYTSGYSSDLGGRRLTLVEGVNFLQKPYTPQKLAEALRNNLNHK